MFWVLLVLAVMLYLLISGLLMGWVRSQTYPYKDVDKEILAIIWPITGPIWLGTMIYQKWFVKHES